MHANMKMALLVEVVFVLFFNLENTTYGVHACVGLCVTPIMKERSCLAVISDVHLMYRKVIEFLYG